MASADTTPRCSTSARAKPAIASSSALAAWPVRAAAMAAADSPAPLAIRVCALRQYWQSLALTALSVAAVAASAVSMVRGAIWVMSISVVGEVQEHVGMIALCLVRYGT